MPCSPWQQTIGERIERVRWRERHLIDRVRMRGRCTRGLEHRLAQYELVNFVGDPTCRHKCDEQIAQPEEHESKTAVGVDRRSGGLNRPEQTEGDNGPRHNISHNSHADHTSPTRRQCDDRRQQARMVRQHRVECSPNSAYNKRHKPKKGCHGC